MLSWSILQYFPPSSSYHYAFKNFVLSIFEWPLKTGFTVILDPSFWFDIKIKMVHGLMLLIISFSEDPFCRVDPGEVLCYATFHLSLQCLPKYPFKSHQFTMG